MVCSTPAQAVSIRVSLRFQYQTCHIEAPPLLMRCTSHPYLHLCSNPPFHHLSHSHQSKTFASRLLAFLIRLCVFLANVSDMPLSSMTLWTRFASCSRRHVFTISIVSHCRYYACDYDMNNINLSIFCVTPFQLVIERQQSAALASETGRDYWLSLTHEVTRCVRDSPTSHGPHPSSF